MRKKSFWKNGFCLMWVVGISGPVTPLVLSQETISPRQFKAHLQSFDQEINLLQEELHVPGYSLAVVQNGRAILSKGSGWADIEKRRPANTRTPYPLASLTKTFTGTLLMQVLKEGKVSLGDRMSWFVPDYEGSVVTIGDVASHTSEGRPGNVFRYNHGRFAQLSAMFLKVTGRTYQQLLVERILDPLRMTHTVLGADPMDWIRSQKEGFGPTKAQRNIELLQRMAVSYRVDSNLNFVPSNASLGGMSAAGGLISTVDDLVKYYSALDRHQLISEESEQLMLTPISTGEGKALPYGLGWFISEYHGTRIAWHYGYMVGVCSSLVIKIPDQKLTLILLANSDGFSAPFNEGLVAGQLTASPVALSFLSHFVVSEN